MIPELTQLNVDICKNDWDSFETSWDFKYNPLVHLCHGYTGKDGQEQASIYDAFVEWESDCNDRFAQLKSNEEELNRIFIDIYGLQEELTPEVADKDVTVRCADLGRDIRSLLSYAVGCMFGRYSLDVPGLVLEGQPFEEKFVYASVTPCGTTSCGELPTETVPGDAYLRMPDGTVKQCTFAPDADNCIPITDEAYFQDDLVGRFEQFIKIVYGQDTLEENLNFIAKALGNKGDSSREVIRNYFLNDFFKDHLKIYQKRPIYWLYDSGKQNGFKALVYMHRYNADTTGVVRVDYLHKTERVYEREITRMQETIDNSAATNREIAVATKRKEKLVKQLKECRDYDVNLGHLALARIAIDLDDGVKVNYEKVQTDPDGKKYPILAKF